MVMLLSAAWLILFILLSYYHHRHGHHLVIEEKEDTCFVDGISGTAHTSGELCCPLGCASELLLDNCFVDFTFF